ncbi:unnamed protein product [Ectocarpus sp. CCAP 1310/34]|nr:unnamed protein product [Ectocarpus sp. CCAP 1310/34]
MLKLVCHFSVKQKSGRKRKPREGEAPTLHTPSRPPAPRANKTGAVGGGGKGSAASAMAAATAAAADSAAAESAAAAAAAAAAASWSNGGGRERGLSSASRRSGGGSESDGGHGDRGVFSGKRKSSSSKSAAPRQKHRRENTMDMATAAAADPSQGGRGPAEGRGSGPSPYGGDGQAHSPHGSSVGHNFLPASANSHNSFAQRPPSPSRSGGGSVSSSSGAVHSPKQSRDARNGRHNYRHVHHRGDGDARADRQDSSGSGGRGGGAPPHPGGGWGVAPPAAPPALGAEPQMRVTSKGVPQVSSGGAGDIPMRPSSPSVWRSAPVVAQQDSSTSRYVLHDHHRHRKVSPPPLSASQRHLQHHVHQNPQTQSLSSRGGGSAGMGGGTTPPSDAREPPHRQQYQPEPESNGQLAWKPVQDSRSVPSPSITDQQQHQQRHPHHHHHRGISPQQAAFYGSGHAAARAAAGRAASSASSSISPPPPPRPPPPSAAPQPQPQPPVAATPSPGDLVGTDTQEADAAAARAVEAKARLAEANARSEIAAHEAKEAAEAAEVAKEAATAVVLPLPATREEITRDGRVGRRENAFLDTYFAFFGRFVRWVFLFLRTLTELALQDATTTSADDDPGDQARSPPSPGRTSSPAVPGGWRAGGWGASRLPADGPGEGGRANGGEGGGVRSRDRQGSRAPGRVASGLKRGVTPEKGASLWAGVGIGAMLQVEVTPLTLRIYVGGASPQDGEVYAKMARDQLDSAKASCANRRQQRVRADLMLCVLYDMLGRYDKSDECLDAGFEGVAESSTHLHDVLDLLLASKQERDWRGSPGAGHQHHRHHPHHYPHHHHDHHHQGSAGGGGAAGKGSGAVVSSVGIGTPRQQTPMLITEGNALSLLNRLSWDMLRRFTKLPFAAASRGGHGGSSYQALVEWRSGEGWYGTLVKAHSHLCADLNDDVRALPRCPLAVGLLKSKLSWLHSCLGRTTAAADKSQVMLALLEPFPGAGRWSLWRHPLHLAACHLAIAGRPGAYEKLRRTFNAFLRPGMFELPGFESFHTITRLCHSCSPTVSLLVKAYMPHLEPLLSTPPVAHNNNNNDNSSSSSSGSGSNAAAAVSNPPQQQPSDNNMAGEKAAPAAAGMSPAACPSARLPAAREHEGAAAAAAAAAAARAEGPPAPLGFNAVSPPLSVQNSGELKSNTGGADGYVAGGGRGATEKGGGSAGEGELVGGEGGDGGALGHLPAGVPGSVECSVRLLLP